MKVGYIDTSVLVSMAFDDGGGAFIARAVRTFDRLYSSSLLESEFVAVAAKGGVLDQVDRLLRPVRLVRCQVSLKDQLGIVASHGAVGGASMHHLAIALYLFPSPSEVTFLSLSDIQTKQAAKLGFKTEFL